MKKILLIIGIIVLLSGIGLIVHQKVNEPLFREQLFEEVLIEAFHRDEPLQKIILIPEQKKVYVVVEPRWTGNVTFPINISVYTLKNYEGDKSHPLIHENFSGGTYFGSFTTTETTQYVFLLNAVFDRYEVYTESIWSPTFIYTIGFCMMLIGSIIILLAMVKSKKIR